MTEALQLEIRTLRTLLHSERDPAGRAFAPLADAYRRAGKIPEALRILREGIAQHPDFVTGHVVAAQLYVEQGLAAEGAIAARRALALDGENVSALKSLLRALEESGDAGEAENVRSLLTTLEPDFQPDWARPAPMKVDGDASARESEPVEVMDADSTPTLELLALEPESPVAFEAMESAKEDSPATLADGMIDLSTIGPLPSADLPLTTPASHSDAPPDATMVPESVLDLELVDLLSPDPSPSAAFERVSPAPEEPLLDIAPQAPSDEPEMDLAMLAPDAPADDEPVMDLAALAPDAPEDEEPVMDLAALAPDASADEEPVMGLAAHAPDAPADEEPVMDLAALAPDAPEDDEPVMDLAMLAPDAPEDDEPVMDLAMLAPDASADEEPVMDLAALAPDAPEDEEPAMDLAALAPDASEDEEPVMDLAMLAPDASEDEESVMDLAALSPPDREPVTETASLAPGENEEPVFDLEMLAASPPSVESDEPGIETDTDPLERRILSAESASPPDTMIPNEEPVFDLEALVPAQEAPATTETAAQDAWPENGRMADAVAREVGLVSSDPQQEAVIDLEALGPPSAGQLPAAGLEVEVTAPVSDLPKAATAESTSAPPPSEGEPADEDFTADDQGEPIPTRTLAELYAQQGAVKEAVAVLRHLLSRNPNDVQLAERIEELEGGWTPPKAPREDEPTDALRAAEGDAEAVETLARDLAESGHGANSHEGGDSPFSWGDRESVSATSAEAQTIREYFDDLLQWEPREP